LRFWLCSGEPFPKVLLESLLNSAAQGSTVLNTYGTTEVAGDVTWAAYDANSALPSGETVPIGKAIPPNVIHLLDPQTLQHVQPGETGEIFVEGPHLAVGYHKRQEENNERFIALPSLGIKRCFRTGDFGKLDRDSMIQYAGRKDQQVKVHGQRVEVLQVESALKDALLEVAPEGSKGLSPACAIMAVPSERDPGSYRLLAFVEPADSKGNACPLDPPKLKELMRRSLLPAHIPESVSAISALPKLVNGKLDRMTLKKTAMEQAGKEGADAGVSEELDSFGQIRRILIEHIESRRIVGTINTMALFTVVISHWAYTYRHPGLHFDVDISHWAEIAARRMFQTADDVAILMAGVAALHGMGDETKFNFGMWEPFFILGWTVIHVSIQLFMPAEGWMGYLYFLPLLFCGRMWVILWHKMLKLLGYSNNHVTDLLSTFVVVAMWILRNTTVESWWTPMYNQLIIPLPPYVKDWCYVPLYCFGFYYGPTLTKSAIKLPVSLRCLVGTVIFALAVALREFTKVPFGPDQPHRPVSQDAEAFFINLCFVAGSWVCLACLPSGFDLTLQGPQALSIYILHLFYMPQALHGLGCFGVNLVPSISDLMLLAPKSNPYLNGFFELLALCGYIVAFMVAVVFLSAKLGSLAAEGVRQARTLATSDKLGI